MAGAAPLHGVTKKGRQAALDCLSLELRQGEVVALPAPNGAGKSSAVRLLLDLSRATAGEVRIFGGMPESLRVREHLQLFAATTQTRAARRPQAALAGYPVLFLLVAGFIFRRQEAQA